MTSNEDQTTQIQAMIDRLAAGDPSAREELINCAWHRIMRLTRKIFNDFPNVRRWEQTEDVFQKSMLSLWKALEKVELKDSRHFLRLAAEKIRFQLIDLTRHYYGPRGHGANHASQVKLGIAGDSYSNSADQGRNSVDPSRIAQWAEVHRQVDKLPDADREVFDLLWYHELSQEEAAELIGVDVRTVKRRWRQAKLGLTKLLKEDRSSELRQ
ncbi:MAG: sigma-70 family RNA polymerase sigma factor [Verrucomicrobia bacterium]|nr:sigma-70 family RNA polymerase sigma factor [Verrucomicrobiota bacterium]